MSVLLMILSVVLVVSTLTGSTNNYYNEPTDIKDCAVTKKFAEITNASMTPIPLKHGERFRWQAVLKIKETIHWGIMHVTLTHNFKDYTNITFLDSNFNLCDYFDDLIKEQCPLKPGTYQIYSGAVISSLFWPGQYYGKATAYNEKGEQILCQKRDFTIV
ncbi:PREDICTED: uncharacterized protein LOC109583840 [Amphimedon queenslandica]|uniref:MD-2-related lipid-recognition domain-containing protein n=1 Tax=Amphimedon queenslandica TaxID=400682 RepID=A0A1X7UE17_AMPQE|nr:PREDICTED: uncharacterized protein LOC109583840 [Amphimedon queenslandica]|eukprot:XP_019854886.1 PREDICTED: uncharacterized protein LOC109583840 [Amphimedon queenslandica]